MKITRRKRLPVRILHIVGGMNRGGAETWLMHALRHVDRDRYRMDFLVHTDEECDYDEEIRGLGSNIIPCLVGRKPWRYVPALRRILQEHGPYQIVHSHVHHYSGITLWAAEQESVPVRIAHSHSDARTAAGSHRYARRAYLKLMKSAIARYATEGVGCSADAAASLFGSDWQNNPRYKVLYCGIDLAPFQKNVDEIAVRKELNIARDKFVVGHVGRFSAVKNHAFIVEIAKHITSIRDDIHFLLVGDGPLRDEIEQMVNSCGLSSAFTFAGLREDVPRLMKGAMDLFLLPSFFEGLPLVGLEAQATGLPLLVSDGVTSELDAEGSSVTRIPLVDGPQKWGTMIQRHADERNSLRDQILVNLTGSRFDIAVGVESLTKMYDKSAIYVGVDRMRE